MVTTVEISMYPFQENYREVIKTFIAKLNRYRAAGLDITTNATSTIVSGEHEIVMEVLGEMLEWSHEKQGNAVFVSKIIPGLEPGEA